MKNFPHQITLWSQEFLHSSKGKYSLSYLLRCITSSKINSFRYFQAGGTPEQVINRLSQNYTAVAQMANLLAEWLIMAGVKVTDVQAMVENHLKDMILKTFDPKKADTIFTEEGETPDWLTQMIKHHTWRSLIYRLAEEYPDCLMLNFTIKLISDAGYQSEITSISTAAQQIEVFSRVLKTSIAKFLTNADDRQKTIQELAVSIHLK